MKSTELRVGNWVNNNEEDYQITSATIVHLERGDSTAQPIPLTEDWLIWFGFEKRESSTCDSWYIGTNEITHDWLFDIVWLHRPELINAPNFPFYRNGRHLIQYVHQLQNLYFALTGEELTINHVLLS